MLKGAQKGADYLMAGIADEHTKIYTTTYLTMKQKKKVLQTLGMSVYILLDHYFWKVSVHSFDFSDEFVSEELGLPLRTVKDSRRTLKREG